ncbi:hypothetical protein [Saccharolobus islandicus]|nr:hypothetical protein [Sulfolobus islandicus]
MAMEEAEEGKRRLGRYVLKGNTNLVVEFLPSSFNFFTDILLE